jgi:PEP-CTERM motif
LVAYDPGPVVVGTWEIKMSLVPEPESMVFMATALLLLVWNRRRRSRMDISK